MDNNSIEEGEIKEQSSTPYMSKNDREKLNSLMSIPQIDRLISKKIFGTI